MRHHRNRHWLAWAAVATTGAAVLAATMLLGPAMDPGTATSHWDAPHTMADKQIDASDLYAFTSPDRSDTVTLIANYVPFQFDHKPYQFDTNARYEIHVDNDGTGRPAVTYRWTFRNKGLPVPSFLRDRRHQAGPLDSLVEQSFTLTRLRPGKPEETLVRDGYVAPTNMGSLVTPGYPAMRRKAVLDLPSGGKVFTGAAADPFFSDNKAVMLLRFGLPFPDIKTGVPMNVNSIALQLPKSELALGGDPAANPVIGVWTTAARESTGLRGSGAGAYKQVSRLGNPNFNEVIIPKQSRDWFNGTQPEGDERGTVVPATLDPEQAKVVAPRAGAAVPAPPRKDLEQLYLTGLSAERGPIRDDLNSQLLNRGVTTIRRAEELRLNMATPVTARPHQYGYLKGDRQGYPNGRRLTDDVVTINLRMLLGEPAGPGKPGVVDEDNPTFLTQPLTGTFPYVALPGVIA
jgi:Domain of unknown function (DUF4331)